MWCLSLGVCIPNALRLLWPSCNTNTINQHILLVIVMIYETIFYIGPVLIDTAKIQINYYCV